MKKVVIKNKLRFTTFLLVVFMLMSALICSTFDLGKVYSKERTDYIVYVVDNGETLWEIASKNNPENKDLRKLVYEIQKLNSIGSVLSIGQEVKIPV